MDTLELAHVTLQQLGCTCSIEVGRIDFATAAVVSDGVHVIVTTSAHFDHDTACPFVGRLAAPLN